MDNSRLTIASIITVMCIGVYGCSDSDSKPAPTTTPQTNQPSTGPIAPSSVGLTPLGTGPIAPIASATVPVTQDPVVIDPEPQDPVVTDPVPQDPVITDPVPEDPVISDPIPQDPVAELDSDLANSELRKLLGTVTFTYGVSGDNNEMVHQATFTESAYDPAFLDNPELAPELRAWILAGSLDTVTACVAPPDSNGVFWCLVLALQGETVTSETDFVFQLISATNGIGVFEFCTPEVDICLNNLEADPDGNVFVEIDPSGIALAQNNPTVNGVRTSQYETELFVQAAKLEFGPAAGNSGSAENHEYSELSLQLKQRMLNMRADESAVLTQ